MFRADAGPGGLTVSGALVAGVLLLTLVTPGSPVAQAAAVQGAATQLPAPLSPPIEEPGSVPSAAAKAPAPAKVRKLSGPADEVYGPDQRAHELYLDGMEKLDAGRRLWAQKTFEDLIARFPDSSAAALARRKLGELYRGAGRAGPSVAPAAEVQADVLRAAEVPPAIGQSPLWEQELRRNASIQAKLRMEAGDRVFFSAGSAELGSRARTALTAQAQWLNLWHEFEAAIEGHADEPGTDEENHKLSQERAEAVRRRLITEGVEASRLAIVAQGRTHRIALCSEPGCSAQNRRAVLLVFASGTRERLGLSAPPLISTLERSDAQSLGAPQAGPLPAASEHVGVAR